MPPCVAMGDSFGTMHTLTFILRHKYGDTIEHKYHDTYMHMIYIIHICTYTYIYIYIYRYLVGDEAHDSRPHAGQQLQ